jgi:hypothetical protein
MQQQMMKSQRLSSPGLAVRVLPAGILLYVMLTLNLAAAAAAAAANPHHICVCARDGRMWDNNTNKDFHSSVEAAATDSSMVEMVFQAMKREAADFDKAAEDRAASRAMRRVRRSVFCCTQSIWTCFVLFVVFQAKKRAGEFDRASRGQGGQQGHAAGEAPQGILVSCYLIMLLVRQTGWARPQQTGGPAGPCGG